MSDQSQRAALKQEDDDLSAAHARIAQLEAALLARRKDIDDSNIENGHLRAELQQARDAGARLHSELIGQTAMREKAEAELQQANERITAYEMLEKLDAGDEEPITAEEWAHVEALREKMRQTVKEYDIVKAVERAERAEAALQQARARQVKAVTARCSVCGNYCDDIVFEYEGDAP